MNAFEVLQVMHGKYFRLNYRLPFVHIETSPEGNDGAFFSVTFVFYSASGQVSHLTGHEISVNEEFETCRLNFDGNNVVPRLTENGFEIDLNETTIGLEEMSDEEISELQGPN